MRDQPDPAPRDRAVWHAVRLGPNRAALLAEASGALLVARLRCWRWPFARLARHLGGVQPAATALRRAPFNPQSAETIRAVRWAVVTAARRMPFRTACLQQAIAARGMLRRRRIGSVLRLGVGDRSGAMLEAHAWLEAGALAVTGYPLDPALTEVGCFVCDADDQAVASPRRTR